MKYWNVLVAAMCWIGCVSTSHSDRIINPLLSTGADPWIIHYQDTFMYCYSRGDRIGLILVKRLSELEKAEERIIWKAPPATDHSKEIWAPELHFLAGKWYVYFAADDGENAHHRMHILSSATKDIRSEFSYLGVLSDPSDQWAIDGTVLNFRDTLYFIWSGWEGAVNGQQNLYIARMDGPSKINSDRILISSPEYDWERRGSSTELPTINEGPEVLKKSNRVYIIYSASGSWSDDYCLGLLELTGEEPLNPNSWKKWEHPVFTGTDEVISPGHCSFLRIRDQDYIVYHHSKYRGAGWKREVSIQPFYWNDTGPDFGVPRPNGSTVDVRMR
ncbi:MAG: glycoside hydrolase family 43 protein [Saprospiraceae bacterium]